MSDRQTNQVAENARLTKAERDLLHRASWSPEMAPLHSAVEQIITLRMARFAALADDWEQKYRDHIRAATEADSAPMAALQAAAGSVRSLCADDLKALLTGGANDA